MTPDNAPSDSAALVYLHDAFGTSPADASAGTITSLEENIMENPERNTLDVEAYRLVLAACPDVREDPETLAFIERAASVGVVF